MNKQVKWGLVALIVLLIAGMMLYPKLKQQFKATTEASLAPISKAPQSRGKRSLNANAQVIKYQSLSDKTVRTGTIIPDEEVDLSFETSGKIVSIFFKEGRPVILDLRKVYVKDTLSS